MVFMLNSGEAGSNSAPFNSYCPYNVFSLLTGEILGFC